MRKLLSRFQPFTVKKALILSVAFNIGLLAFFFVRRIYINRFPAEYPGYASVQANYHKQLPIDTTDIVFVGNSLVANFPVEELFGTLNVKNRGIGGNKISDIKKRLPQILQAHPKKVILASVSTNDINTGMPVDSVCMGTIELIDMVRKSGTELIYQSVIPFAGQRAANNNKVGQINDQVAEYCKSVGVRVVDLESVFLKEGVLNPAYTFDGTHLNGMGYLAWRDAIKVSLKP